jgi:hypothetical protein
MSKPSTSDWLSRIQSGLQRYLASLAHAGYPGRFSPCLQGAMRDGSMASLGFSCFALKTYYTVNLWDSLDAAYRAEWISFLKKFQVQGGLLSDRWARYAFIDPPVYRYIGGRTSLAKKLMNRLSSPDELTPSRRLLIAETKQAIATLDQIDEKPAHIYRAFPVTAESFRAWAARLDWTQPWAAGGQLSGLAVFFTTQAPCFLDAAVTNELIRECRRFIEGLADSTTGGYYSGSIPEHGELVNGAMKILTALDWLDEPIHFPEQLINTCLSCTPLAEGCHLVDTVYVLYRCSLQTNHQKSRVQKYCGELLALIREHYNTDGGFSYFVGKSQTSYYGVPISQGLFESDIHGTCLLSWALAMIHRITENTAFDWKIIRP